MAETLKPKPILPTLKSCCFCSTLRTGSLIIGWYYLVVGVLAVITMLPRGYSLYQDLSPTTGDTGSNVARLLIIESYFLTWIMMIACIYLINGIRKKIPNQVRPFVVYGCLIVVFDFFNLLLVTFTPLGYDYERIMEPMWGKTAASVASDPWVLLIFSALDVYLVLIVHSYYKQLKQEVCLNNPGAIV